MAKFIKVTETGLVRKVTLNADKIISYEEIHPGRLRITFISSDHHIYIKESEAEVDALIENAQW